MIRVSLRRTLLVTAAGLVAVADWLEGDVWHAHSRGRIVKVTRFGVSTIGRH